MTRPEIGAPTLDLFDGAADATPSQEPLGPGAVVLRQFARTRAEALWKGVQQVTAAAPLRHMVTPNGFTMSVAMTNCGTFGWVSDASGYRYDRIDPDTAQPWPPMPEVFMQLASDAALAAGFPKFVPDACLVNRYRAGTRLSLHQDRNERDMTQPIVSVSLGIPAIFLFGGARRTDKALRVPLQHGDVVVWGGPARLHYHGVLALKPDLHPLLGECRVNLTFRRAG